MWHTWMYFIELKYMEGNVYVFLIVFKYKKLYILQYIFINTQKNV